MQSGPDSSVQARVDAKRADKGLEIRRRANPAQLGGRAGAALLDVGHQRSSRGAVFGEPRVQCREMPSPELLVDALLGEQPLPVPVAGEDRFAREQAAHLRMLDVLALVIAV